MVTILYKYRIILFSEWFRRSLDHIPRMESYENSQCLWENSKKTKSWWPQFLQNTELFLEWFLCPSQEVDRTDFISAVVIHMPLRNNIIFATCGLPLWNECLTHVILLNPKSINCQIPWIKLAIGWGIFLPHFSALLASCH